mmetsp:Transcript_14732/g.36733  ORF Transcript_14732/g.36733 Transcript_14732/m.36733 type:complete len:204 (-) Transcript_14732:446-1057(-)
MDALCLCHNLYKQPRVVYLPTIPYPAPSTQAPMLPAVSSAPMIPTTSLYIVWPPSAAASRHGPARGLSRVRVRAAAGREEGVGAAVKGVAHQRLVRVLRLLKLGGRRVRQVVRGHGAAKRAVRGQHGAVARVAVCLARALELGVLLLKHQVVQECLGLIPARRRQHARAVQDARRLAEHLDGLLGKLVLELELLTPLLGAGGV